MPQEEIRDDVLPQLNAREFNLVDSKGRVRIKLYIDEDDDACATFRDASGEDRLNVIICDDGTLNVGIKHSNGHYENKVFSK